MAEGENDKTAQPDDGMAQLDAEIDASAFALAEAPPGDHSEDDVISLDDLDSMLESSSQAPPPAAKKTVEAPVDEDVGAEADQAKPAKPGLVVRLESKVPALKKVFDPFRQLRLAIYRARDFVLAPIKRQWQKLIERVQLARARMFLFLVAQKNFLRVQLPELIKGRIGDVKDYIGYLIRRLIGLKDSGIKRQMFLLATVVPVGAGLALAKRLIVDRWNPFKSSEAILSFGEVGSASYGFNPRSDFVLLYKEFPQPEYQILLTKVIVNLKRSYNHPAALAAAEFYLSLDSEDTAIEVRDRENELRDKIERIMEGFTFQQANSKQGILQMKDEIRQTLNRMLNQGEVLSVGLKAFVTNP